MCTSFEAPNHLDLLLITTVTKLKGSHALQHTRHTAKGSE